MLQVTLPSINRGAACSKGLVVTDSAHCRETFQTNMNKFSLACVTLVFYSVTL